MRELPEFGWTVSPITPDFGDVVYGEDVHTTAFADFKAPFRRLLGVRKDRPTRDDSVSLTKLPPGESSNGARARSGLKQRVVRMAYTVGEYANSSFGWLGQVRRPFATSFETAFDAIISTSPPAATHLVAARAHGAVPWIADLRDPWYRRDDASFRRLLCRSMVSWSLTRFARRPH